MRSINRTILSLSSILSLAFSLGCAPQIGDSCVTNLDCGTQIQCDQSQPDGYCTVSGCIPGSCPDESICVEFDNGETWCMAMCESNEDCRDDYVCREGIGVHPFCGIEENTL